MKITDVRVTTVTVPLKSTIRHCVGAHWGRIVRTIVEIETDEGISGLGEARSISDYKAALSAL